MIHSINIMCIFNSLSHFTLIKLPTTRKENECNGHVQLVHSDEPQEEACDNHEQGTCHVNFHYQIII